MTHVTLKSSARAAAISAARLLAASHAWSAGGDWRDAEAAYDKRHFAGALGRCERLAASGNARDQSAPDDEPYVPGPDGC